METPITFIVENKNGVYIYPSVEVEYSVRAIRISSLDEKGKTPLLNNIFNRVLITGKKRGGGKREFGSTITDILIEKMLIIKNTKDLVFELSENSKIRVTLFVRKIPHNRPLIIK